MDWVAAGVVSAEVLLWFWVPGALVAWACRVRGLALGAIAPLVTLGLLGVAAILVDMAGWRWSPVTALTPVVVIAGAAAWYRSPRPVGGSIDTPAGSPPAVSGRPGSRRWLGASVLLGVLAQLVPVAVGMGRPTRLLTAYDAVAHFTMVAYGRDAGRASSLAVTGVNTLDGSTQGFYGAAWHGVVALVADWPDASTVFNVGFFVPVALAWTLGLAFLTQAAFPSRPRLWCWAAGSSAAGIAVPLYLALRPEGMVANAMGVALVPALVALVTTRQRPTGGSWVLLVGACAAGVGLTHPNALLSCALVLLPWLLPRAVRALRRITWTTPRRFMLLTSAVVIGGAGVLVGRSATMHGVIGVVPESPQLWWEGIVHVMSGDLTGMGWASGFLIICAAILGNCLARRLPRAHWLVGSNVAMVALYLLATSPIPFLTDIDRPWYGEPRRFAPVVTAVMIPFAALAIDSLPGWALSTGRLRSSWPAQRVRLVLGVLVLAFSTVPATIGLAVVTSHTYVGTADLTQPPVASDAELAMMARLTTELDAHRAILGSAFSGAAHLYGLNHQRVMPPSYLTLENDDLRYVRGHIDELSENPQLCQALERLGVDYLYVDPATWETHIDHVNLLHPPPHGTRLVDSGGTAAVYEITAC